MRSLGVLLLIIGAALAVQGRPWLPPELQLAHWARLPALPVPLLALGLGVGALGLALVALPRRRAAAHTDDVVRAVLEGRGFLVTADVGGWRADGEWDGRKALIRRVSGYEAARFGRPWIIEVSLRGAPREPWPLHPEEGTVVDRRDHGFSVTIPALGGPVDRQRASDLISTVVACVG